MNFFNGAPLAQRGLFKLAPTLGLPIAKEHWRKSFAPLCVLIGALMAQNALWPDWQTAPMAHSSRSILCRN
jgi:hypothetical protein